MTDPGNQATAPTSTPSSPKWNWTTKLVIGLVLAAVLFFMLIRFQTILGPVLLSFIISYLIYPVANFLHKKLKIGWRASVSIIYIIIALVVLALLTWGGISLIQPVQNLITFIQNNIDELPTLIENLADRTIMIGQKEISLSFLGNTQLVNQAISAVEPLLGKAGTLVGKIFSGGANLVFWIVLMLLISFFVLAETEGVAGRLIRFNLPGYEDDLKRMGRELGYIWNAFIRGQLIVIAIAIVVFTIVLGSLGVQYFFVLALVAAFGRLIPYVGAWISWISYGLVALLQANTPFGLTPFWFMVLVVVVSLIMDNILDNVLVPKVMSNALRVHPAAVLLATLIGAQLLGVIGVILAAPVLASLQLIFRYLINKLTDTDPWEILNNKAPIKQSRWWVWLGKQANKFKNWVKRIFRRKPKQPTVSIESDESSSGKN
jgi:predicted PurR-regulated permease PerM